MRRRTATSPTGRPRISARPDVGKNQLHQQLQRGGLAGAVRTEKAEDLAPATPAGQAVERDVGTRPPEADRVVLGEPFGSDGIHSSEVAPAFCSRYAMAASKIAGRAGLALLTPLMKKVGVPVTPSLEPSAASFVISLLTVAVSALIVLGLYTCELLEPLLDVIAAEFVLVLNSQFSSSWFSPSPWPGGRRPRPRRRTGAGRPCRIRFRAGNPCSRT